MLFAPDLLFDDEEPFFELDAFLVEDDVFAFAVVLADFDFDCAGFAFDEVDRPALDLDEADFAAVFFLADDPVGAEAFVDFPADDFADVFDDPDLDFDAPVFGLEDFLVVGISYSSPISDLKF